MVTRVSPVFADLEIIVADRSKRVQGSECTHWRLSQLTVSTHHTYIYTHTHTERERERERERRMAEQPRCQFRRQTIGKLLRLASSALIIRANIPANPSGSDYHHNLSRRAHAAEYDLCNVFRPSSLLISETVRDKPIAIMDYLLI